MYSVLPDFQKFAAKVVILFFSNNSIDILYLLKNQRNHVYFGISEPQAKINCQ